MPPSSPTSSAPRVRRVLTPKPADLPRIHTGLKMYRLTSIVTGSFLLLLVLMMVFRYGFGVDIELAGPFGFLALTPKDLITGVNLSTVILILHGWFYVAYLYSDFRLWSLMRWEFSRFLLIALGGVVPFLSFVVERRVHRTTVAELAAIDTPQPAEASH